MVFARWRSVAERAVASEAVAVTQALMTGKCLSKLLYALRISSFFLLCMILLLCLILSRLTSAYYTIGGLLRRLTLPPMPRRAMWVVDEAHRW